MFRILFLLLLGFGAGHWLRRAAWVNRMEGTTRFTVFLLLFVFGVGIGSDSELTGHIAYFGRQALVLALLGVAGSFAAAWLLQRLLKRKGGER